jgi:hypothetical protein
VFKRQQAPLQAATKGMHCALMMQPISLATENGRERDWLPLETSGLPGWLRMWGLSAVWCGDRACCVHDC